LYQTKIMNNILTVTNINKSFSNKCVLDGISLDIKEGEVFGLVGPNGSGKTTLIRIILGIIPPDGGKVQLNIDKRKSVGYLPEDRGLFHDMNMYDAITYLVRLRQDKDYKKHVNEAIDFLGLSPHVKKKVSALSHGLRQLAQIAVVFAHHPKLAILDEPFIALDPVNVAKFREIIRRFNNKGTTIILSTHKINEIEDLCTRMCMIHDGHAALYDSINNIKTQYPKSTLEQIFVKVANGK
jgi:ABC-2 type transport system ATP-binding protein